MRKFSRVGFELQDRNAFGSPHFWFSEIGESAAAEGLKHVEPQILYIQCYLGKVVAEVSSSRESVTQICDDVKAKVFRFQSFQSEGTMSLPSWLYNWLYPEIPHIPHLRTPKALAHPTTLARVQRVELVMYNGRPPRYSRRWLTNCASALISFPFVKSKQAGKRIWYRA